MSPDEAGSAEDLELDGSETESVVGGSQAVVARFKTANDAEAEVFRLGNAGYVECACIDGGTMMENSKTGHRISVMFR